ncbi:TetR/AcrR family transcriptional regulator [Streptomyces sp. NRRL F-5126]|uniref:TetR/AcrR family transcriptional regulator n=1 Tax=Streptomyces sp. NRRL F-5126 TaxID=1463857 RepID=UPI00099BE156
MRPVRSEPLRSDALRNRRRILEAAWDVLTEDPDASITSIARKAHVGQGTFYRHFPSREALILEVYRYEVQQVAESADRLLATRPPERALREWLDRLSCYAMTKAGLAEAMRKATCARGSLAGVGHDAVRSAVETLLAANHEAGTVSRDIGADDLMLAIAGLWQIDPAGDWEARARRLLDLVVEGLRASAPRGPACETCGEPGTLAAGGPRRAGRGADAGEARR